MKMMTRCPACGTGFRVYRDQLDARHGQVRCGHCAVVFDANLHLTLFPEDTEPTPSPVPPEREPTPPLAEPKQEAREPEDEQALTKAEAEATAVAARENAAEETPAEADAADDEPHASSEISAPEGASHPAESVPRPAPIIPVGDTLEDFGFAARSPRSRAASVAWGAAATLLMLGLLAQALYFFRVDVVKTLPALRPPFEQFCAQAGCRIPYPQDAALISIEASDLQALPGARDVLVLSAVLRNRAAYPQTFPTLELTLTDAEDKTAARRVLRPRDYLPGQPGDDPVFAAGSETQLKLHIDAAGLGASGYRLFLFYP